ncbi:hypothetical protein Pst134EA_031297 [Puccinia striiformis f. sp. tritici]|uniref:uncharacterized protein n=1 Tax=Puccinia striiformis f. sp. tritici TaxID=168172 RepID=UPI0020084FCA|nr:uncharacterized protein Pst134EA_031297 [Puccinia striiformis f. sp. tritici]KAH9443395.1 hypothetical protein Pst134EA_031297 [Puccinia striiformis f. sp. tritici]
MIASPLQARTAHARSPPASTLPAYLPSTHHNSLVWESHHQNSSHPNNDLLERLRPRFNLNSSSLVFTVTTPLTQEASLLATSPSPLSVAHNPHAPNADLTKVHQPIDDRNRLVHRHPLIHTAILQARHFPSIERNTRT